MSAKAKQKPAQLNISPELSLPLDMVTSTTIVYGGKGMGKTNLLSVVAEELAGAGQRFAILDPMGVCWGLRHAANGKDKGLDVLILGGIRGDLPIEPTGGAVVADLVADENVSVVIDISLRASGKAWSKGEKIRFVRDYAIRLYERQSEVRRPLLQIIDEAARFIPQTIRHGEGEVAQCMGAIAQICEEGRALGLGLLLVTQRSARLNKDVAELADSMIAFRTIGPNSMGAIMDWLGEHVPKDKHKALSANLRELPVGSALVVSPGWLAFEGVVAMRARQTFDSSATPKVGERRKTPTGKATPPDLERYQQRMAETIERANADDPAQLKRQVASLRRELTLRERETEKARATQDIAVDPGVIESAREFGYQQGREVGLREASASLEKRFESLAIEDLLQNLAGRVAVLVTPLQFPEVPDFGPLPSAIAERPVSSPPRPTPALPSFAATVRKETAAIAERPVSQPSPPRSSSRGEAANFSDQAVNLPEGERKVLIACAQYGSGIEKKALTILTGFKRSTRDAYLQRLKGKGFIEASGQLVTATAAGVDALGADYARLPEGIELQEHWRQRLPEGEWAILNILIENGGVGIHRDTLTDETGYKRSTRDAYIQRLKSRQLVTVESGGLVRAAKELF